MEEDIFELEEIETIEPKTKIGEAGYLIASVATAPVALALKAAEILTGGAFLLVAAGWEYLLTPFIEISEHSWNLYMNSSKTSDIALGATGNLLFTVPTTISLAALIGTVYIGAGIVKVLDLAYQVAAMPIKGLLSKKFRAAKEKQLSDLFINYENVTYKIEKYLLSFDPHAKHEDFNNLKLMPFYEGDKFKIRANYKDNKNVDMVFYYNNKFNELDTLCFLDLVYYNSNFEEINDWDKSDFDKRIKALKQIDRFLSQNKPDEFVLADSDFDFDSFQANTFDEI